MTLFTYTSRTWWDSTTRPFLIKPHSRFSLTFFLFFLLLRVCKWNLFKAFNYFLHSYKLRRLNLSCHSAFHCFCFLTHLMLTFVTIENFTENMYHFSRFDDALAQCCVLQFAVYFRTLHLLFQPSIHLFWACELFSLLQLWYFTLRTVNCVIGPFRTELKGTLVFRSQIQNKLTEKSHPH